MNIWYVALFWADWAVRSVLKICAILLKYPTFFDFLMSKRSTKILEFCTL